MNKVDYDNISKGFSESRKNMRWEEIYYFISDFLSDYKGKYFLDIGCGSARLLEQFSINFDIDDINYLGVDLSIGMLEEAKKSYPNKDFLNLDMLNLDKIKDKKFDFIFLIASFHHLQTLEERVEVLEKIYSLLKPEGKVFFTNWFLNSPINHDKYKKDIINDSENEFGSMDYNIYFGDYPRFYHCFTLDELEYLFKKTGFEIIENGVFDTKKNFVSIIKKIGD
ncbi:MAG: class I SAM-dependent methyltransferase [Candidatus Gracilibacteria bacterium]|nr:class I SAM-dependent methyltransferase [Candidatus Gracilibacteria bacterium]